MSPIKRAPTRPRRRLGLDAATARRPRHARSGAVGPVFYRRGPLPPARRPSTERAPRRAHADRWIRGGSGSSRSGSGGTGSGSGFGPGKSGPGAGRGGSGSGGGISGPGSGGRIRAPGPAGAVRSGASRRPLSGGVIALPSIVVKHCTTRDARLRNRTTAVWGSAEAGSYAPMLARTADTRTIVRHGATSTAGNPVPRVPAAAGRRENARRTMLNRSSAAHQVTGRARAATPR